MAQRVVVQGVNVSAADLGSDKWIATADCRVTDSGGKNAQFQSQVYIPWPLVATGIRAALATQIIADAATLGYGVLATDIAFPDAALA